MDSPTKHIEHWVAQGQLPAEHVDKALALSNPSRDQWHRFFDQLSLWLGGLALSFSLLFFIAYNWTEMGRLFKFALVEVAMLLSILGYVKLPREGIASQVALMMSAISLGVLLALFGQIYQTGADPWQLFANWALLLIPWALISRSAAMWLLWLMLINIAVNQYFLVWGRIAYGEQSFWLLWGVNTLALAIWELAAKRYEWLNKRWATALVAAPSAFSATMMVIFMVVDNDLNPAQVSLAYLIWFAAMLCAYRYWRPDLSILVMVCLSGIVSSVFVLFDWLENAGDWSMMALVLSVYVVLAGGFTAHWLNGVHKEFKACQ